MQTKNIFWDNEIFIDCSMEPPIPVANDNYLAVWNKHLSTLTHYPYLGDKLSDGVEVVEGVDYKLEDNGGNRVVTGYNGLPDGIEKIVRIVAIGIPKATEKEGKSMNRHEAVEVAKKTPFPCLKCGNILTGYTSIGFTNSEIARVCKCGYHNTRHWWGSGYEWINPLSNVIKTELPGGGVTITATPLSEKTEEKETQEDLWREAVAMTVGPTTMNTVVDKLSTFFTITRK